MNDTIGSVGRLWRFPVKSMGGEQLDEAAFTARGLLGDRAYALIDLETGKVASAKSVRRFPSLLHCQAAFVEAPALDKQLPPVRITLPNGTAVTSDAPEIDRVLSAFFERAVSLTSVAPDDYTIDQYHPDVVDADPSGLRDAVVDQKLGAAYYAAAGKPSPVAPGTFFDLFPVSLITTSTLDQLSALQPGSNFDERRFRMNLVLRTEARGFVENDWIGRQISLVDGPEFTVELRDPRCVMTTLAQGDLPKDTEVLRTMVEHNRVALGGSDRYPCAGVYAVVHAPGVARAGAAISLR